jgi:hypothetical protein
VKEWDKASKGQKNLPAHVGKKTDRKKSPSSSSKKGS